jgi:predicted ArsR family transcriptional regulator
MEPAAAERDGGARRRALVLSELRAQGEPLSVAEVADRLGVHPNTARFHLDGLVADGIVVRTLAEPDGPGRPRAVYAPRPGMDRSGGRDYLFLSRILLSRLAADAPGAAEDARETGRAWGRHLALSPVPFRPEPTADEAVRRLTELLADLGFSPESEDREKQGKPEGTDHAVAGSPSRSLRLRHCPFLELAEEFGSVVCPLHLGLMQGALEQMDAPITASALEPFAEPGACVVRLAQRRGTGRTRARGAGTARRSRTRANTATTTGPGTGTTAKSHSHSDENRT